MGSLADETSTSEFAVTFVRKLYFLPVSFRCHTALHGPYLGITYSRWRAGVRRHPPTPGPERVCFVLTPWFLLVPQ